ncbi:MAG: hypothetical protein DSZ05_03805 [Sulfurospirillum sp.]|nr:MAG: hypothetical protein DSZ05_03805 [Sulfurospirillum sp.]
MNITQILKKSFSDFKSPLFLGMALLPFVVILVVFGYGYFHFGSDLITQVGADLDAGRVPFLDPDAHPWLTYILTFSLFKWLFTAFFYLVGIVAVVLFSVVIAGVVIGFFTPTIVKVIRKKHYPDFVFTNDDFTFWASLPFYVKIIFGFLFLGLVSLPFMFVPAVNFIAINIPFYYLFHNFMILDVGSNIVSTKEFKLLTKKYKTLFRSTTATLYGISLVPVVGVFMQVFYVIVLSHEFFEKASQERS